MQRRQTSSTPTSLSPLEIFGVLGKATLADGSECIYDRYQATVVWDGKPIEVFVDEMDADSLVGMRLLNGYELKVQVRPEGKVTIKRLR